MKVKIDGIEVEGTIEDISKVIGIMGNKDSRNEINTNPYSSFDYIHNTNPCNNCPNKGKGPCHCTLPYMTWTGTGGSWNGNYSVSTSATYTTETPENLSGVSSTYSRNVRF